MAEAAGIEEREKTLADAASRSTSLQDSALYKK